MTDHDPDPPPATSFERLSAISAYFALDAELPAGWQPVRALLDEPDVLDVVIGRVGARLGTDDRRIAASILFQGWAARLTSIYAGSIVLGAPVPDLGADRLRFHQPASGPVRLALATHVPLEPAAAWRRIADAHLEPLVDAIRARIRIGRRQLWGNVASALAGSLGTLDRTGHAPLSDTIDQPWANPGELTGLGSWTARDGGLGYVRTTCCEIERIPGRGRCGDCSLTAASGGPADGAPVQPNRTN